MDIGRRCRIITGRMDTSQAFLPQDLRMMTWQVVTSVAFSLDGRFLASAHPGGIVHIWDVATGESLQELKEHIGWACPIAFSPDGRHIASALRDHTVHVWDAVTGAFFQQLNGHTAGVETIAFSPDGFHLASGSWDCTVRVWDTATGVCIKELRHDAPVSSVAFSLGGYLAFTSASTSRNDAIHVWDLAEGSPGIQKLLEHNPRPPNISFSAGGSMLRVEYSQGPPVQLHFPSLKMIDTSLIYLDNNSLCVKHQGLTLHLYWLPDYFIPCTPVAQQGNCVCIGGEDGMIAFVELNPFALPYL